MRDLLRDPWVQLFAPIAIISGTLLAAPRISAYFGPPRSGERMPAPAQSAAGPNVPNQAAGSPGYTVLRKLAPKRQNRWILGSDPDADSANFMEIMLNARNGDAILIQPGVYAGSSIQDLDLTFVGQSPDANAARLEGLSVHSGKVIFRNLTLAPCCSRNVQAVKSAAALNIDSDAEVSLESVRLLGAVDVFGRMSAQDCEFHGGNSAGLTGLSGIDAKAFYLENSTFLDIPVAVSISKGVSPARLKNIKIRRCMTGLTVTNRAQAHISHLDAETSENGLDISGGAVVTVEESRLSGGNSLAFVREPETKSTFVNTTFLQTRDGLSVSDRGEVEVISGIFRENRKTAISLMDAKSKAVVKRSLFASNGNGIHALNDTELEVVDSEFSNNAEAGIIIGDRGVLQMAGGSIKGNKECGIYLKAESQGRISGTLIDGNSPFGITLERGALVTMRGGQVINNRDIGVALMESGSFIGSNIQVGGNGGVGFGLMDGAKVRLENSYVNRNQVAVKFSRGGILESYNTDFSGNYLSVFDYKSEYKTAITLKGSGNKPASIKGDLQWPTSRR